VNVFVHVCHAVSGFYEDMMIKCSGDNQICAYFYFNFHMCFDID